VVAGDVDSAMSALIVNCSLVIIVTVVPWRDVWQRYVRTAGDPWRP